MPRGTTSADLEVNGREGIFCNMPLLSQVFVCSHAFVGYSIASGVFPRVAFQIAIIILDTV